MKRVNPVLLIMGLIALAGCSDSSSGGSSSSSSDKEYELSGSVIDGYVYNAHVYIDINDNGIRDDADPQAITNLDGTYTLQLSESELASLSGRPILVEINKDSVDVGENPPASTEELEELLANESATTFFSDDASTTLTLALPPISQAKIQTLKDSNELSDNVITPYSTRSFEIVKDKLATIALDEDGLAIVDSLVVSANKSMAMEIATILETDYSDDFYIVVTGDFINPDKVLSNSIVHEKLKLHAQTAVTQLRDDAIKQEEIAVSYPNSDVNVTTVRKATELETMVIKTDKTTGVKIVDGVLCRFDSVVDLTLLKDCGSFDDDTYSGVQYPLEYETFTNIFGEGDKYTSKSDYRAEYDDNGYYARRGYAYDIGAYVADENSIVATFERYLDERHPDFDERVLESGSLDEFVSMIDEDNLSNVDMKQFMTETEIFTASKSSYERIYKEAIELPFEEIVYCENLYTEDFVTGASTSLTEKYWGCGESINEINYDEESADGSLSTTNSAPAWYGSDPEYPTNNMWLQTNKSYDSEGNLTSKNEKRYILDEDTNSPKLEDGEPLLFSDIVYEYNSDHILKTWKHYEFSGYDFTKEDEGSSSEPL